ncbi:hypothetical protein B7463_g1616, partial [Scytalidium lignicola]
MTSLSLKSSYKIKSGYEIPTLGFGLPSPTGLPPPEATKDIVLKALQIGYRHIDTAIFYGNEIECSEAIRESNIPRSEIFLTTKLAIDKLGYENAKKSIISCLEKAGEEYFDLILIHAPYGGKDARLGAWKALSEAQKQGKVHSIGVSNFGVHHLNELEEYINTEGLAPIDVGQYELHPWLGRTDIVSWLSERNIVIEAYCPLTRTVRLEEPGLVKLGEKHHKTPSQVLLRWSLQKVSHSIFTPPDIPSKDLPQGFIPLPKSSNPSRIAENANIYDFELSKEDMDSLYTEDYSPVTWDPTTDQS